MAPMSIAKGSNAPEDDSDLEDLITKQTTHRNTGVDFGGGSSSASPPNPISYCANVVRVCIYTCPKLCKCTILLLSLCLLGYISNTIFNPSIITGIMGADYSAIKSAYDLSLSQVDHWCIRGDNDSCKCEDPLEPTPRAEFKAWTAAHKANVADVNMYRAIYGGTPTKIDIVTNKPRPAIDVAFLGESVVEAMDGRWLGKKIVKAINTDTSVVQQDNNGKKPDIGKVFERFFRKDKGGPLEGVALGIAGDNTANVLWRLQHDEMPYDFNPKVWWLVLGMNDLTRMQCSEEIVVLGILRVVEEIMLRKPDALIVINSLLPMLDYRSEDVKMSDVVDFKTDPDTKMKENMEIDKAVKGFVGRPKEKGNWKFVPLKKGELPPQQHQGEHSLRRLHKGHERIKGAEKGLHYRNLKKLTKKQKKEDEAMDGPDLRNAIKRAKKELARRDKKFMNKKFSDNERFHPKKPLSPFLPMLKKKALPPVWPAVHLINEKLKEFCTKHEQVTFFDATSIFADDVGGGKHNLYNDLISPRGHPSELGFAVWEGRIMGRLDSMFKEMAPPPPAPTPPPEVDDEEDDDEVVDKVVDPKEDKTKGLGSEHVSEGKIAEEPPPKQQPPRDDALEVEKKKVDSKGASNTKKSDEGDEDDDKKEEKKTDNKVAKENEEEDDDNENEEADDDEKEEANIDSKAADDKSTKNMKEDKEEEVDDDGEDNEDDE